MENLISCPICGSEKSVTFLNSKDHFFTKESFSIVQCQNCGLKYTNPRPSEKDAGRYYESVEYLSHNHSSSGLISTLYSMVRFYTSRQKALIVAHNTSIKRALDIGCGTGEFLNSLQKKGFEVQGVEPNETARMYAKENFNLEVEEKFDAHAYKNNSIGVVTMWHVLEHIYDLAGTIKNIHSILHENGTLIVALPNPESHDARHYREYWGGYDLPRHLYHFNRENVNELFLNAGFELINTKPMYFDAFYVSLLSEKYKNGKLQFIKALVEGLRSNLSAIFKDQGFSSQIYIFRLKNS